MDAQIIAAWIGAASALAIALWSFFSTRSNGRALERLKAELADRSAFHNARLEYEFEARKRLYKECAPILFELTEASERALGRIIGLARTAEGGNLEPGRTSWLRRRYYKRSTYYRLFAPLALVVVFRRRLTHLDLSLDPNIYWQYEISKRLADSFTDDFDVARIPPAIPYTPHADDAGARRLENPAQFWQQGIPRGILDNAVASLLDASEGHTIVGYAAFEQALDQPESEIARAFGRIEYLFEDFHPRTRPVLWRILLGQAHLYQATLLSRTSETPPEVAETPWGEGEWEALQRSYSPDDPNPFLAGQAYASAGLRKAYRLLWAEKAPSGPAS